MKTMKTKERKQQEPTILQKKALTKITEQLKNNQRVSISQVMRAVGYSESSATKPSNLTKSKAWQNMLEEYFPDDLLLKEHKGIIKQNKDKRTKLSAISEIYKLKDKYPAQKFKLGALKERDETTQQVEPLF